MNRRNFLSTSLATSSIPFIVKKQSPNEDKKIRLGFIGVGLRGRNHLQQALYRSDVEIPAVCDIDPNSIAEANKLFKKFGKKEPIAYMNGERDFENYVKREDLDGIIISTPWEWHVPMAVAAMKAGKYAGVEVSATVTLQESWDLIDTYEKTGSHCMILENVCYRRDIMSVLNMVRKNMFGEMLYGHCG
ncbi:MAG: Gfo/Idh/MocA family protein, partial [Emticicia sp.]